MPKHLFRSASSALLACALVACSAAPDNGLAAPDAVERYIAFGQSARVGPLTLSPARIVEDSRCPSQANCVWAGRLIVETTVAGRNWQQTVNLVAGQPQIVREYRIVLSEVRPEAPVEGETKPGDYRFAFAVDEQI